MILCLFQEAETLKEEGLMESPELDFHGDDIQELSRWVREASRPT